MVTGASGYIGRHLSRALLEQGWEVRGLNRSGRPPGTAGLEWVRGDLCRPAVSRRAVAGCRAIVHLADLPLAESGRNPAEAPRINVGGTLQVLEAARQAGVDRLIFASTGQVYGGQARLPNRETQLCRPDTAYAASKLAAEVWCATYARIQGLPVQIVRVFNVSGVAVDGSARPTVEAVFPRQIRAGQRPRVLGHPASGRDFIHVGDVVRALCLALERPVRSGPVNVGTGTLTSLVALAHTAARVLGVAVEPELIATGEPPTRFQADPPRVRARPGFRPAISLEAGPRRLAADMDDR